MFFSKLNTLAIVIMLNSSPMAMAESLTFKLIARDGKFTPAEITAKSQQSFILEVENQGSDAEEFESIELRKEKIIMPGKTVKIKIGPLKAGTYNFFGDFHPETAKGKFIITD